MGFVLAACRALLEVSEQTSGGTVAGKHHEAAKALLVRADVYIVMLCTAVYCCVLRCTAVYCGVLLPRCMRVGGQVDGLRRGWVLS